MLLEHKRVTQKLPLPLACQLDETLTVHEVLQHTLRASRGTSQYLDTGRLSRKQISNCRVDESSNSDPKGFGMAIYYGGLISKANRHTLENNERKTERPNDVYFTSGSGYH